MTERIEASDVRVQQALGRRKNKFGAKRTEVDGIVFDSAKESRRYEELKLLHALEEIYGLDVHPSFSLDVDGVHIADYEPDFTYYEAKTGRLIVEDVKSAPTRRLPSYRLKVKLLKALYGYDVTEIC